MESPYPESKIHPGFSSFFDGAQLVLRGDAEALRAWLDTQPLQVAIDVGLIEAAGQNRLDLLNLLLPHADGTAQDSRSLRLAVSSNHRAIVVALLPHSDPLALNSSALVTAAGHPDGQLLRLLLPLSGPPEEALVWAVSNGCMDNAKLLWPLTDMSLRRSQELLVRAAENGQSSMVDWVLDHHPSMDTSRAFIEAARYGFIDLALRLTAATNPFIALDLMRSPVEDGNEWNDVAMVKVMGLLLPWVPSTHYPALLEECRAMGLTVPILESFHQNEALHAALDAVARPLLTPPRSRM